ncbi:MAG: YraN family protein [Clostridia bacterium]|nr:YraN family protein [Clostridia bacterium]
MSDHKTLNQEFGQYGEDQAAQFCHKQNLKILKRNYRCRYGEIDIIASRDDVLHFIEVKNRSHDLIPGRYAVNIGKQRHIRQAAQNYLMQHNLTNTCLVSFDVIEITDGNLEFLENCFY